MPMQPIAVNGGRQPPGSSVLRLRTISGVTTEPSAAPLCRMLLPRDLSARARMICVVTRAQGQCPDSKNPSATRHARKP